MFCRRYLICLKSKKNNVIKRFFSFTQYQSLIFDVHTVRKKLIELIIFFVRMQYVIYYFVEGRSYENIDNTSILGGVVISFSL